MSTKQLPTYDDLPRKDGTFGGRQIRGERHETYSRMKDILDKAEAEGRNLTDGEARLYDQLDRQFDELTGKLSEAQNREEREMAEVLKAFNSGRVDPKTGLIRNRGNDDEDSALLKPEQRMAAVYSERDGEFSLGRLIRARITGSARDLSEIERRAMAEGTDAAGGVVVPEELSANIIDRARAQAVIFQAGALTAPMQSDTLVLARLATGNTATWKVENDPVTATDQTWERVELKAKTVHIEQIMSRELFEDLSREAEQTIRNEIAQALALALDFAALEGTGTDPEPRGIANTTGVNSISMGTNGATPTDYREIVKAHFANLKKDGGSTAGIFHPRDLEEYALLEDSTGQPLRKPDAIANLPLLSSTQLKIDRTQGTATDASNAYVGDFSQMIVGVRPSVEIRFQVLTERHASNLQVSFLAWLRADVVLAHPEHFTKIVGLIPTP